MTQTEPTLGAPAPTTDCLRLLRLLARAQARAHPDPTSRTPDSAVLISAPSGAIGRVALADWRHAEMRRWIIAQDDGAYRISAAGRHYLRRALSQAGAPNRSGNRTPLATDRPATTRPPQDGPPRVDLDESPLAWLARRRDKSGAPFLTAAQLDAGERFRTDFWFAGMSPHITTNWSPTAGGNGRGRKAGGRSVSDETDRMTAARERIRLALAAVGPELSGILIDVCGPLLGLSQAERRSALPKRSAKLLLQIALTGLARHYGLTQPTEPAARRPRQPVQHWGAPDYKPTLQQATGRDDAGIAPK